MEQEKNLPQTELILYLSPNIKHVLSNAIKLFSIIIAIYSLSIYYLSAYYLVICCIKKLSLNRQKFQFDRIAI